MAKKGRPSKFDAVDLDQVRKVAQKGWTDLEMADFFEVAESTWYKWKVDFPDFSEALKEWKVHSNENVERALYERAIGYTHSEEKIFNNNGEPMVVKTTKHYPPDTGAATLWLKNRAPDEWKDKQEHAHSGEIGFKQILSELKGDAS